MRATLLRRVDRDVPVEDRVRIEEAIRIRVAVDRARRRAVVGLAVRRELVSGIAGVLPTGAEVAALGVRPERPGRLRHVRPEICAVEALGRGPVLRVDREARRLRGEVARTDALSRWDREVERSAAGVAGGDGVGMRAHREVDPEAEEWHAGATRLEPAATDDEPAAGPCRRDTAERQDDGDCRERAI